jgi:hypothetical protein
VPVYGRLWFACCCATDRYLTSGGIHMCAGCPLDHQWTQASPARLVQLCGHCRILCSGLRRHNHASHRVACLWHLWPHAQSACPLAVCLAICPYKVLRLVVQHLCGMPGTTSHTDEAWQSGSHGYPHLICESSQPNFKSSKNLKRPCIVVATPSAAHRQGLRSKVQTVQMISCLQSA